MGARDVTQTSSLTVSKVPNLQGLLALTVNRLGVGDTAGLEACATGAA
jgi:hypothetical protein